MGASSRGRASPSSAYQLRSTKAGARTPATPGLAESALADAATLNEGRGANPGYTRDSPRDCETSERSTKAGARTPATLVGADGADHRLPAQRRPGREPRRHSGPPSSIQPWGRTLNEGRGANPGDTLRRAGLSGKPVGAQRRPGREPRRHGDRLRVPLLPLPRSTKAGARTPATLRGRTGDDAIPIDAQRRPGREPRRHVALWFQGVLIWLAQRRPGREPRRHSRIAPIAARCRPAAQRRPGREPRRHSRRMKDHTKTLLRAQRRPGREPRRHATRVAPAEMQIGQVRSTKAGARTRRHAQSGVVPRLVRRRSTKAGARTPATRASARAPRRAPPPLNEGRGANPGDTGVVGLEVAVLVARSTKAGARTPATHVVPGRRVVAVERSTKAGARTPATQRWSRPGCRSSCALNEGRGANPGDTQVVMTAEGHRRGAQRRPGREPRRHLRGPHRRGSTYRRPRSTLAVRTLNEGRGANPGDTRKCLACKCWHHPAQRRPGREPRRHRHHHPTQQRRRPRSTKAGARTPATPYRMRR